VQFNWGQDDSISASRGGGGTESTKVDEEARAHSLTTLRIAFFLHVYYENQEAGGVTRKRSQ
jgi:hypothetical protein